MGRNETSRMLVPDFSTRYVQFQYCVFGDLNDNSLDYIYSLGMKMLRPSLFLKSEEGVSDNITKREVTIPSSLGKQSLTLYAEEDIDSYAISKDGNLIVTCSKRGGHVRKFEFQKRAKNCLKMHEIYPNGNIKMTTPQHAIRKIIENRAVQMITIVGICIIFFKYFFNPTASGLWDKICFGRVWRSVCS